MIRFSKEKVLLLHQIMAEATGGSVGVRDEGVRMMNWLTWVFLSRPAEWIIRNCCSGFWIIKHKDSKCKKDQKTWS